MQPGLAGYFGTRPYDAIRRATYKIGQWIGVDHDCFFSCQYNGWLTRHQHLPCAVGLNVTNGIQLQRLWLRCTFTTSLDSQRHGRTRMRQALGDCMGIGNWA